MMHKTKKKLKQLLTPPLDDAIIFHVNASKYSAQSQIIYMQEIVEKWQYSRKK